ncbi:MAG: Lrp/AsnC ligand binding domain-containing protein [Thermomicrobiales bacterium]|nr:Lrp/AsnC ligand binding domain-containing protein [Thermomicrobiales bacterium]
MKAYVLMTTGIGASPKIQEELRSWGAEGGIQQVDAVAGNYDVVAVVEAAGPKEIGDIVMGKIQHLDGVLTTVTLFSIG